MTRGGPGPPPEGLLTRLLALSHLVPAFGSIPLGLVAPASSCHDRLQEDPKTLGTLSPRPQLFAVTFGGKAERTPALLCHKRGHKDTPALQLPSLGNSLGHYLGGGLWASLTFLSFLSTPAASLWFFLPLS